MIEHGQSVLRGQRHASGRYRQGQSWPDGRAPQRITIARSVERDTLLSCWND